VSGLRAPWRAWSRWRWKRRRRAYEAWLCAKGDVGEWDRVRRENDEAGVWR
jgi:hypothetical protein